MRILLLSAYDAVSHQYWRQGLVQAFPEHEWTVLTLPARYFSWRIRGNSLSWAFSQRETLTQSYDLVIATSMVDLTSLRGFVPALANIPTLVYFHENQFAYPESGHEFHSVEPQILNIYNALCADKLLFNSAYNRDTFLDGANRLFTKLPDQVPTNLAQQIRLSTSVLHVPLPDEVFLPPIYTEGPLEIIWNHRWEFDKGPELLLQAIRLLIAMGAKFRLHVVGQQFRKVPKAFPELKTLLETSDQLGHWGHIADLADYRRLLQQADIVLSTALHDFQGIAVLEAVAAGCRPLVPDRLAYQELFASPYRYSETDESHALASQLAQLAGQKQSGTIFDLPNINHLRWSAAKADWAAIMQHTASPPGAD
ncbi:tRNA-queuosine alpha-mannosyltransferase domain-containing protein [Pontibacter sp. JAM-7]|uniref:tRNA-queuosine alpha-mannosyltransferase domain-containing protein n=1 Tax=Pontibacter sp. JAM-7 TaxID=3366581 RepID=UPI003AF86AEE